jgi:hypothetical protein
MAATWATNQNRVVNINWCCSSFSVPVRLTIPIPTTLLEWVIGRLLKNTAPRLQTVFSTTDLSS